MLSAQSDSVMLNSSKAIFPKVFIARGQEYPFKKNDPIFKLSSPVDQGEETNECFFCLEVFKSAKTRRWCDFCGKNMCLKCTRMRQFELPEADGYNNGQIDLLCLKKFHILEMCNSAQDTCKMVERDIKAKQTRMKDEEQMKLGQLAEEPEYLAAYNELKE